MSDDPADRRSGSLESRWRQVLETAPQVYLALDATGAVRDGNRAAWRLLVVSREEVLGRPLSRFVPERERARFEQALQDALAQPAEASREPLQLDLRRADGSEFAAEHLVWGVDRRGDPLVHCFVRDVTESRRAHQTAALLAAVVEGSSDAIITEGPDARILTWNPASERMFGWSGEEAVGEPSRLIVPADRVAEHLGLVAAVLRGQPVRGVETERLSRAGVRVPVTLRMSPVEDASGAIVAVSTVARDVTEERWMARTLDETLDRLQTALAEAQVSEERSRRFLADAAHQLRTPLTGIRACAELLLRGVPEADRDRLLAVMVRETSRSARLITGLLRIARLDQGEPLPVGAADLLAVCRGEVDRLSLLAPELQIALDVQWAPPDQLPLDAGSCEEILSNLGDNARRHAASRVDVTVTRDESAARVLVRVSDDGPGVPEDARERVFDRFVSLDSRGGSGLGLPIARALALAMDGELTYAGGFVLALPLGTHSA